MSQLDALKATQAIKDRMVQFACNDHYVRDAKLGQICEHIWRGSPERGGLTSDLWVEGAFPSQNIDETMGDLVSGGLMNGELAQQIETRGAFPLERSPYTHQHASLAHVHAARDSETKPGTVISAGTGAGKTEAFLLPLLDDLYDRPISEGEGVSCVILYPMNALVNDQVDRLYDWLQGQNRLSLFHFTGETPENHKAANYAGTPTWSSCRFRTRQHARGLETSQGQKVPPRNRGPQPNILVTNYSMLEYMLCRPQDAVFFGKNLRHIVLDEAHLYTGNLAAEISLLLRRLYEKCGTQASKVFNFATSATISESDNPEAELKGFASRLFSKPEDDIEVILGKTAEPIVPQPPASFVTPSPGDIAQAPWTELPSIESSSEIHKNENGEDEEVETTAFQVSTEAEWNTWKEALAPWDSNTFDRLWDNQSKRTIAPFLMDYLGQIPLVQKLYHHLRTCGRTRLTDLAKFLFGSEDAVATEAVRRLLQAGAMARKEAKGNALLPNRVHLLVRSPDTLSVSFDPSAAPSPEQLYQDDSSPPFYVFSPDAKSTLQDTTTPLLLLRDRFTGDWYFAGINDHGRLAAPSNPCPSDKDDQEKLWRRLEFFASTPVAGSSEVYFDPSTGRITAKSSTTVTLYRLTHSPTTGKQLNKPRVTEVFGSRSRLQISLLAEAALMQMPEMPGDSNKWKPARGRRMLIFSDSRSEAARLGPAFTSQHEVQLFRAALMGIVADSSATDASDLEFLTEELEDYQNKLAQLPEGDRKAGFLQKKIKETEIQIRELREGYTFGNWPSIIETSPLLAEFFNRPFGEKHTANRWKQKAWERNQEEVSKDIGSRLETEFARRSLWPDISLETAGEFEVYYPHLSELELPETILGILPTEKARHTLATCYPDFAASVLDEVRTSGCITLGDDTRDKEYGWGGASLGKWLSLRDRNSNFLLPLLPSSGRNILLSYTQKVLTNCDVPEEDAGDLATRLLEALFEQLGDQSSSWRWLQSRERQTGENTATPGLQIVFAELGLRRPLETYRCEHTGQIWARSVAGTYPRGTKGNLIQVTSEQLDGDSKVGRNRSEWRDSVYFKNGLWAEEHSAQLSANENRRIQDLFKKGCRNILSSTTTLELGIDIGGLHGVLMGNIPPGKANYLQRAGRAGRRADGSSLVLCYSRPSPYDKKVFLNFGGYLDQPLRKPTIFLDREQISRRHLHSLLLSSFFAELYDPDEHTGAMEAFGNMGVFCGEPSVSTWRKTDEKPSPTAPSVQYDLQELPWLPSNHTGLSLTDLFGHYLDWQATGQDSAMSAALTNLAAATPFSGSLGPNGREFIASAKDAFHEEISSWKSEYQSLFRRWSSISSTSTPENRCIANSIAHQMRAYYKITVIEALGDRLILPRYGFPIGLSRLRVASMDGMGGKERVREEDQYRLQRSSMLALREYVPGSKLLVGAKVVTSRGILKHWTGNDVPDASFGLRGWYRTSLQSGRFEYNIQGPNQFEEDASFSEFQTGEMLFARHGFTSAAWEEPQYGSRQQRVGTVSAFTKEFEPNECDQASDFGGLQGVNASHATTKEIIVMNAGDHGYGFAVCTKCGYAESEVEHGQDGRIKLPRQFEKHASLFSARDNSWCWDNDETFVIRNQNLAAKHVTNLIQLDFGQRLNVNFPRAKATAKALGQALRLAACEHLQLDPREIGVLDPTPSPTVSDGLAVVLYDSVAGGSGHVTELFQQGTEWIQTCINYLDIDETDERRAEEALVRRLITADSPLHKGQPHYSACRARRVLLGQDGSDPSQSADPPTSSEEDVSTPTKQEYIEQGRRKRKSRSS